MTTKIETCRPAQIKVKGLEKEQTPEVFLVGNCPDEINPVAIRIVTPMTPGIEYPVYATSEKTIIESVPEGKLFYKRLGDEGNEIGEIIKGSQVVLTDKSSLIAITTQKGERIFAAFQAPSKDEKDYMQCLPSVTATKYSMTENVAGIIFRRPSLSRIKKLKPGDRFKASLERVIRIIKI